MRKNEVLEAQEILPRGGKHPRGAERDAFLQALGRTRYTLQPPRTVAGLAILNQRPRPFRRPETAARPRLHRGVARRQTRNQRRPIQAVIRTDAGIASDAETVIEEEAVDRTHDAVG